MEKSPHQEEEAVKIKFSHVRCNPVRGGRVVPGWFVQFHVFYATLLFADGIREVLKA